MRKRQPNHIICFILTFLLLSISVQVSAGTLVHVSKVRINKTADTLILGKTDILKAAFTPTNATNRAVKWTSSNSSIAKVDIWGKVTSLKVGATTIRGVTVDKSLKVACKITVKPKPVIHISKVRINKTADTLTVGKTDILKATFTPINTTNRAVKWTSSNSSIAKVDVWGKVTSLKVGTTTITGVTIDKSLKIACKITVKSIVHVPNLSLLFYLNDAHNFQSITFFNQYLYCGFDVGDGKGEISKYSMTGKKISQTYPMEVGHSADLGYRVKTGNMYMANGGNDAKTHVYVVNYNNSKVLSNLNYESLGTSALLAIDNVHDYLILHTVLYGGDLGNPRFTIINLANMKIITTFTEPNQGVPQGLESDGNHIYLYTNNKITTFDYNGIKINTQYIYEKGESEGITMVLDNNVHHFVIGYTATNRIYEYK